MPQANNVKVADHRASRSLHEGLDILIAVRGIRAVLSTIAGICEQRAEELDNVTPGNSAANRWAKLAVHVDIAAGHAGKL